METGRSSMSEPTDAGSSQQVTERGHKLIVRAGAIISIGIITSKALMTGVHIILARKLGSTDYGLFALSYSLVAISISLLTLGLPISLARYVPVFEKKNDIDTLRGVVFSICTAIFILGSLMALGTNLLGEEILVALFRKPRLSGVLSILMLGLPFQCCTMLLAGALRGLKAVTYNVLTENIAGPLIRFVLVLIVLSLGINLSRIAWVYAFSFFATCVLGVFLLWRAFPGRLRPLRVILPPRDFVSFAWPMFFVILITALRTQLNTMAIGALSDSAQVGFYSASLLITQALLIFLMGVSRMALPVFSELFASGDRESLRKLYKDVSSTVLYASLPFFVLAVAFARQGITLLYGKQYLDSVPCLQILAGCFMIHSYLGLSGLLMLSAGKSKQCMMIDISSLVILAVISFSLVGMYGAEGASVALGTASVFVAGASTVYIAWRFRANPFSIRGGIFVFVCLLYTTIARLAVEWLDASDNILIVIVFAFGVVVTIHATRYSVFGREPIEEMILNKFKRILRSKA